LKELPVTSWNIEVKRVEYSADFEFKAHSELKILIKRQNILVGDHQSRRNIKSDGS
jgi:hypothetical protein